MNRHLISLEQLAQALGCSRRTVERWLSDGRLERAGLVEANRIGWQRMFDASSVEVVLFRRRTGGLRRVAA